MILLFTYVIYIVATPQEIYKIREAIKNASSLAEVERLTRMLQTGQIPGQKPAIATNGQTVERGNIEETDNNLC